MWSCWMRSCIRVDLPARAPCCVVSMSPWSSRKSTMGALTNLSMIFDRCDVKAMGLYDTGAVLSPPFQMGVIYASFMVWST